MDSNELMKVDNEVLEDINKINEMIEEEKLNQKKDSTNMKELKEEKEEKEEKESTSNIRDSKIKASLGGAKISDKMERLHLRIVNDTIDILYRPNHEYISFVPNDESGLEEIKRIASMTRDEFKEYLKASNCFRFTTASQTNQILHSNAETWYKGAWALNTTSIFKKLGIENPVEEPFFI